MNTGHQDNTDGTSSSTTMPGGEYIVVRGRRIPIERREIRHVDLRYSAENPRVYSIVRKESQEPTQDDIEEHLQKMEHVLELRQDIRRNGGLIDSLVVRGGTLEVIEGNSRLAALRYLAREDPVKWDLVKCRVLPEKTDLGDISALLAQWHLKGKKEWPPYEQAGFLYRRNRRDEIEIESLALEVGLGRGEVKRYVDTYDFMLDNDDRKRDNWSYYEEYLKSRKILSARKKHRELDSVVVDQIKAGVFARAQDLRDQLPSVCQNDRVLKKFIRGDLTLEEAHERAVTVGAVHPQYQKVKAFRGWLADQDVQKKLVGTSGEIRDKIEFEFRHLLKVTERMHKKLKA